MIRIVVVTIVTVCFLCLTFMSAQANDKPQNIIIIAADEWCPINCDPAAAKFGNTGYGIGIDLAKAIFEPAGYKVRYVVMPWSRALELVRQGKVDAVVGANMSDEPTLIFPNSAIYPISDDFYVLKDKDFTFKDISSLKGHRLGLIKDYGYNEIISNYVKSVRHVSGAVQETTGEDALRQNIEKLLAARVDVLVESRPVMDYTLKKTGLQDKIRWAGSIPQGNVYLGFSPVLGQSKQLAQLFDKGVAELKTSGKLGAMYESYGLHY
jgi:polar amino acid transport system substrate-binding protein